MKPLVFCQSNNRPQHISIDWILTFHPPWHKQHKKPENKNVWKMIHFPLGGRFGLFFKGFVLSNFDSPLLSNRIFFNGNNLVFLSKHLFSASLGRCHQGQPTSLIKSPPCPKGGARYFTLHICAFHVMFVTSPQKLAFLFQELRVRYVRDINYK